ncbi:MAG: PEP/pyruvate-binding domain-containing protein [Myxococcota bacterium]
MSALLSLRSTPLATLEEAGAGGKALGLARLHALGLDVPEAYVLVDGQGADGVDWGAAASWLCEAPLAVRSSSAAEDGAERSFAGQYESVLNVQGEAALRAAIQRCLASVQSARADAYSAAGLEGGPVDTMAVVIQRMIQPTAAGVLFTADPTTGRRDRIVLDAVPGLGEALVSGEVDPDHVLADPEGEVLVRTLPDTGPVLTASQIKALVLAARGIEAEMGQPIDLEWAIDEGGTLWWLQARPITTLPLPLQGADTVDVDPEHVYTRCNIGEMMPGAVTPLTLSVTVRGIDYGIQAMQVAVGVRRAIEDRAVFTATFGGHIFLNLSAFGAMVLGVAGSNTERLCRAVCGRPLEELQLGSPAPWWRRALNGVRYGLYLLSAPRHRAALARDLAAFKVPELNEPAEMFAWIDGQLPVLYRAYDHHMTSSAVSGALVPALLEILSGGAPPTNAHEALCAALLTAGADEQVESLDLAAGVGEMAQVFRRDPEVMSQLSQGSACETAEWLSSYVGQSGEAWRDYMGRHGHRSLRELELRQAEWGYDPTPVIASVQVAVRAETPPVVRSTPSEAKGAGGAARWVAARARRAAAKREETKSSLVALTTRFKAAYRGLGARLVAAGALTDVDQIFFLSHEEVGEVVHGRLDAHALTTARRDLLVYQSRLGFPEVFVGRGIPEDPLPPGEAPEGGFVGKAVSPGRAEGFARVVTRLDQLQEVRPGEILIATVVDVGWTPCFPLIAGLATEIGSAVSHGCVVAREFGLPAMVGLRGVTQVVETGQWVVLDADCGILEVHDEAPS